MPSRQANGSLYRLTLSKARSTTRSAQVHFSLTNIAPAVTILSRLRERVSNYDNLAVKPHVFTDGNTLNKMCDADLTSIIQHGGPALNRSPLMPPYGSTLSVTDVRALIAYARAVADPPYQPAGTVYARR